LTGRIKVGLVGIGNCFAGLIQGIEYYRQNPSQEVTGIIHDKLAGYGIHDIDFVCGFDVGENKVGKPLNDAIYEFPNMVDWIPKDEMPRSETAPESTSKDTSNSGKSEDRDVIFVGTKPIMTYVSATLTQLSTRQTVTIKARGKRITQAVDVSQMIVKRMDSVGYVISDVRISSDSLTSQDGKQRNVSTMEIDISKN